MVADLKICFNQRYQRANNPQNSLLLPPQAFAMTKTHKTIIDANKKSIIPDFRELYQYKDLFLTLAWRDFRVRYAQTTIGLDRKSTRLNSSHVRISYAVFCLKKQNDSIV